MPLLRMHYISGWKKQYDYIKNNWSKKNNRRQTAPEGLSEYYAVWVILFRLLYNKDNKINDVMELFCRETGSGKDTLVIVHGLYGSSDNWMSIAQKLGHKFRVILPDLRNHGQSPHSDRQDFELMADDLYETLIKRIDCKFILAGHSMGGKVAMRFAMKHPELHSKLVVIDIAPESYIGKTGRGGEATDHPRIVDTLLNLHPERFD